MQKVLERFTIRPTPSDQINSVTTTQTVSSDNIENLNSVHVVNPTFNQNDENIEIEIQNQNSKSSNRR